MSNKDWKRLHADVYDGSNTGISTSSIATSHTSEVCDFYIRYDDDDDDDLYHQSHHYYHQHSIII